MHTDLTEILLRRKNQVLIPEGNMVRCPEMNTARVLTLQAEMMSLGYVFSKSLTDSLKLIPETAFISLAETVLGIAKHLKGADRQYHPLYPGFPEQVMELSDMELLLNALAHYWTNGLFYPETCTLSTRLPINLKYSTFTTLEPGSMEDLKNLYRNTAMSQTSVSASDITDMLSILDTLGTDILPDTIPFRETKAVVCRWLMEKTESCETRSPQYSEYVSSLEQYMDTPTDILRLAAAYSGSDQSLSKNPRFTSFPRRTRRLLLSLLSASIHRMGMEHAMADMLIHTGMWERLGEKLHPGEKGTPENIREAFRLIRNKKDCPYRTKQAVIETAAKTGDKELLAPILASSPGLLARKLESLLRNARNPEETAEWIWLFSRNVKDMPTRILLSMDKHFQYRLERPKEPRVFLPKGMAQKAFMEEKAPKALYPAHYRRMMKTIVQTLLERFRTLPELGRVWIEPELRVVSIPLSQRSASRSLKTLPKGSRVMIEDGVKVLRSFIWWTNMEDGSRVDLDLSYGFFDKDWDYLGDISWTNLRERYAVSSGDIVNGGPTNGKGVAEFLDIDLKKAREEGIRYVSIQVHSYTGQPFSALGNASFGWMSRKDMNSGETFEPSTVGQRLDLSTPSAFCMPAAIDLEKNEIIWMDMSGTIPRWSDNRSSHTIRGTAAAMRAAAERPPMDMYSLFLLHGQARGILAHTPEEADTLFTLEPVEDLSEGKTNITAYDLDKIQSEFMA